MCRSWDMTSNARKYFEKSVILRITILSLIMLLPTVSYLLMMQFLCTWSNQDRKSIWFVIFGDYLLVYLDLDLILDLDFIWNLLLETVNIHSCDPRSTDVLPRAQAASPVGVVSLCIRLYEAVSVIPSRTGFAWPNLYPWTNCRLTAMIWELILHLEQTVGWRSWFENWYFISVSQFASYSTQHTMWLTWTRFFGIRYSVMDRITLLILLRYAAHMSTLYSVKNDGSRTGSGFMTRLFTSATWVQTQT